MTNPVARNEHELHHPGKKGELRKLGQKRKNWLNRFFTLEANSTSLRYYKDPERRVEKGRVTVLAARKPEGASDGRRIDVECSGNRVLSLEAKNADEARQWLEALQKAVRVSKNQGKSQSQGVLPAPATSSSTVLARGADRIVNV